MHQLTMNSLGVLNEAPGMELHCDIQNLLFICAKACVLCTYSCHAGRHELDFKAMGVDQSPLTN